METALVTHYQEALAQMNAGQKERAAALFSAIVEAHPDWEHGLALHNLAGCLEDLGDLKSAEQCYQRAIQFGPGNPILWGGYASFLFLHGEPERAFEAHLRLLKIERAARPDPSEEAIQAVTLALKTLADRLSMSPRELSMRIDRT